MQTRTPRYKADLTAGSLKIAESRVIADLLLRGVQGTVWNQTVIQGNVLKARNQATTIRLARLIRLRLETMGPELWKLVRDGTLIVATQATLAAAIKHSFLLGDFLDLVVRDQYRVFGKSLVNRLWGDYVNDCRGRDPFMPEWSESTIGRLRSSVFQTLAQAGYVEDTRTLRLKRVNITAEVISYLERNHEDYVLRCITVGT